MLFDISVANLSARCCGNLAAFLQRNDSSLRRFDTACEHNVQTCCPINWMGGQPTAICASMPREIFTRLFRSNELCFEVTSGDAKLPLSSIFLPAEESRLARRRRLESGTMGERYGERSDRAAASPPSDQPEP
jgi:hypothetical protein